MAKNTTKKPVTLTLPPESAPAIDVDALVNSIGAKIDEKLMPITERIEKLEQSPVSPTADGPVYDPSKGWTMPNEKPQEAPAMAISTSGHPIPAEYVSVVQKTLNQEFVIDMNYQADNAAFIFSLVVPRKYSNATEGHWNMYHEDRRSKVIENALGINGVRDWVELVYNSFDPETRARIVADRV